MSISLQELDKATLALEVALTHEKSAIVRDAVIQRFEFCVELSWKSAKKVMGTATSAPKQVVREMAQNGIISNVDLWLKAIDQRNLTVHTYNENLAEEVFLFAQDFLPEIKALIITLKNS